MLEKMQIALLLVHPTLSRYLKTSKSIMRECNNYQLLLNDNELHVIAKKMLGFQESSELRELKVIVDRSCFAYVITPLVCET